MCENSTIINSNNRNFKSIYRDLNLFWCFLCRSTQDNWLLNYFCTQQHRASSTWNIHSLHLRLCRVIQEESALICDMIVCVILSKKFHTNMGPILNGYGVMGIFNSRTRPHVKSAFKTAGVCWLTLCIASITFASWLAHNPVSLSRHLANKGKVGWVFAWLQADAAAVARYGTVRQNAAYIHIWRVWVL